MKQQHKFTHGGSNQKNSILLVRSLLNISAFMVLGIGLILMKTSELSVLSIIISICGVSLVVFLAWLNIFGPLLHFKK